MVLRCCLLLHQGIGLALAVFFFLKMHNKVFFLWIQYDDFEDSDGVTSEGKCVYLFIRICN